MRGQIEQECRHHRDESDGGNPGAPQQPMEQAQIGAVVLGQGDVPAPGLEPETVGVALFLGKVVREGIVVGVEGRQLGA